MSLVGQRFLKMNGLGNAITVLDLRGTQHRVTPLEAQAIAREPRSTFDQLMVLHDSSVAGVDAYVRIYNTDGSESGACGNGTRCVAWALFSDPVMKSASSEHILLQTKAGLLPVQRLSETVFTVDMGAPKLGWQDIPLKEPFPDTRAIELQIGPIDNPILDTPSVVNMGNPHAIFWVKDVSAYQLDKIGPLLELHPIFPEKANISLAEIVSRNHIRLRVWERGVGLTQACGSAACAALVAAVRKRFCDRSATVTLPGGDLQITWRETDSHVFMTGPVELEHEGILEASFFLDVA